MKQLLLTGILLLTCTLWACKKKSDDNASSQDKFTLLTGNNQKLWLFVSAKNDNTETLAKCQKDNLLLYRNNKTLIIDEGAVKCDSTGPQSITASWKFNDAQDSIFYAFAGFNERYKIDYLTDKDLKLSVTDTAFGTNTPFVYSVTFRAQ